LENQHEREQAQARQDAERLKNDPAALKQELNAQATDLARKDLEQQMASQADQLRDKLANDAALRAEVGDLLDYQQRLAGAAANVAGGAKLIGEMLEPSVWDLLSPAAKAVKLSMIVAAMKGGATEFKIGSQVAGELATIEQLSGKLNDLNAGKLPGEAELSKYYDRTPLGQAISEASKTSFGGAKATSKVIAQYGPMNQGPLPKGIADTFRSGTYSEVVTEQPTTLYRVYGGTAQELGGYWTATKPAGPVQSIIDSALDPQWGNTATKVVKIEVPAGVKYFEGVAAPQRGLVGGGSQVLFPKDFKIDASWISK